MISKKIISFTNLVVMMSVECSVGKGILATLCGG